MKYSTMAAFGKHLEGAMPNHFSEIYLVLAKEASSRKQAEDAIASFVLKGEKTPALCLYRFDAEKQNIVSLLQELTTLNIFAKKRVVIAHNVDELDKAATLKLEAYASSPNRSVCFVAIASTINRATTFYKKMEKVGVVLDIPEEKPWEKEKNASLWLYQQAVKEGKQLSQQHCDLLIKQVGTDRDLLSTELQKLICFVGERNVIGHKDIISICSAVNLDNGWQLGEAIFRRDASTALRISKGLLNDGVATIALLRQIRSQFQTEFQVCSILVRGGGGSEVAKEFPYMKGSILDRHIEQSQSYGLERFKQGLLAIDDAELQAKNTGMDSDFLIERLMIKLTL
ncbi:MAG: DNA polymerase III subunit delta [Parachlamydiaceae bacterium]